MLADRVTGTIAQIGTREDILRASEGGRGAVEEVDLGGKYCIPGLVDAHAHLILGGSFLSYLDLSQASSSEEFVALVVEAASRLKPDEWLFGFGWDENKWVQGGKMLPKAEWINRHTGENPVCLTRADGHLALVNDRALRLAQISSQTEDPEGGEIERDAESGEPTGILKDAAITLVRRVQPVLSKQERMDAISKAMDYGLSNGVTMVHDMGVPLFSQSLDLCMSDLLDVYFSMAEGSEMKFRVYACVPLDGAEELQDFIKRRGWSHPSQMLSWGCVKEFYDGSLGSETALMHEPYTSGKNGIRIHQREALEKKVAKANGFGMQVIMHAIGDLAVDEASAVLTEDGGARSKRRQRLEHVQHVSNLKSTFELMKNGGIFAVVNPLHLLDDAKMMLDKLGVERSAKSYAFKSMLLSNVSIAFGSDWPLVAPLDPLGSIMAATDRVPYEHLESFVPEEAISREEALIAATRLASMASFTESLTGTLDAGMKADFVVLDRDILTCKEKPVVLRTFVNGQSKFKFVVKEAEEK